MKTYVVNLRRRTDRREYMNAMLPSELDVTFTSDWDGPFDGTALDVDDLPSPYSAYANWQLPFTSGHRYWDRPLLAGEVGCTLSHLHVWQHIAEQDRPCLVLEDDVAIEDTAFDAIDALLAKFDADPDLGMCYVGRSSHGPEPEPVDGFVTQPGYTYGSFGYVLSPNAASALTRSTIASYLIPVDEFLPAMYMNHPRPDVRMLFPKRIAAIATKPALVTTSNSMGSDSEGQVNV